MPVPHPFCQGYTSTFRTLVQDYPGTAVYPAANFRTEWGPIFHRGRLNGTAKLLVIGQDPAAHENICRRILVGEAGQRIQGFVAKLGVGDRYVMVNTFLYSLYGSAPAGLVTAPALAAYRHRWFDALLAAGTKVQAVVALGGLADQAWAAWRATPAGAAAAGLTYVKLTHPTADAHANVTTAQLLQNWNAGLLALAPVFQIHPAPYGAAFVPGDLSAIPEADLPAGVPAWMRALAPWADRVSPQFQTTAPPLLVGPAPFPAESPARYTRRHAVIEVPTTEVP